jgi:hypothetical protein
MERARTVVYRRDGTPAYAGQALLLTSCGNGRTCHSSGAAARHGVPLGLDFDPHLVDDQLGADVRLRGVQELIHRYRDDIYADVLSGSMPPGEVGRAVDLHDTNPYLYFRSVDDDGTLLPEIASAEGAEILRNWLACASPVVERTRDIAPEFCRVDTDCSASRRCVEATGECEAVGATIERRPVVTLPKWSELYRDIIRPSCVAGCHTRDGESPELDLSTAAGARTALLSMSSRVAGCGMLVVPGAPDASLLVAKLENTQPMACGKRMPDISGLTVDQRTLISEWIADGALDD